MTRRPADPTPSVPVRGRHAARRARRWIADRAVYGVLAVSAAAMLLPFFWMLSTSLDAPADVFRTPPVWLPRTRAGRTTWRPCAPRRSAASS